MRRGGLALGLVLLWAGSAQGQGTFTPGAREILLLNFGNVQPGQVPAGVRLAGGTVDVVTRDGVRMLRATIGSEFSITLPEVLPTDFTIEFDLVPKACGCGDNDLEFDGTAGTWSGSSARVEWSPATHGVRGGGSAPFSMTTPALAETAPGQLTRIIASFEGNTLKLYTNGQRLYTLSNREFARGRVLRVVLGGHDEEQAVYLARVRVAAGAGTTVVATQSPSMVTAVNQPTIQAVGAAAPAATITPMPAAPPPATAGAVSTGPVVTRQTNLRTGVGPAVPLAPRTVALAGFTAVGGYGSLAPRIISLSGFTAAGGFATLAPRIVALSGFTAAGFFSTLAPRTITLAGFTATGTSSLVPRTVALSGFVASGVFASLSARTITLSGFTAAGGFPSLASRTIELPGFTASGNFITLAPRTITLSGWSALGIIP